MDFGQPCRAGLMIIGLVSTLSFAPLLFAQIEGGLSTRVRSAESTAQLPQHVRAPDGELTLFADFDDVRGNYVVLYLVNRTDRRIGFSAQDGDPYVKQETLGESGQWERAQSHMSSWCGNSYDRVPSLVAGEFFRFLGYSPAGGATSTVRYRVYRDRAYILKDGASEYRLTVSSDAEEIPLNLVSNIGQGRVLASDVADARHDSLAPRFGNFDAVREMALGLVEPTRWARWTRKQAVEALQRFPDEKTASVLEVLLEDGNERVRYAAIRGLGIIGMQCPVAEARFQELLVDEDADRRAAAITTLADRPVTLKIIQRMEDLLDHSESRVRAAALFVTAKACKSFAEAHKLIREYEPDPDPGVRSFLEVVRDPKYRWCPPVPADSEQGP